MSAVSVDHLAAMRAGLIGQFKDLPNLDAFIRAIGNQLNDVDEFFGQLFANLNLQNAVGIQLDNLGLTLAQSRNGLGDDDYRTLLQARISAYRSTGNVESLLQIILGLGGASGAQVIEGASHITVTVLAPETIVSHSDLITALLEGKPAGVLMTINTATVPEFIFDNPGQDGLGAGFDAGHFAGPFS